MTVRIFVLARFLYEVRTYQKKVVFIFNIFMTLNIHVGFSAFCLLHTTLSHEHRVTYFENPDGSVLNILTQDLPNAGFEFVLFPPASVG